MFCCGCNNASIRPHVRTHCVHRGHLTQPTAFQKACPQPVPALKFCTLPASLSQTCALAVLVPLVLRCTTAARTVKFELKQPFQCQKVASDLGVLFCVVCLVSYVAYILHPLCLNTRKQDHARKPLKLPF